MPAARTRSRADEGRVKPRSDAYVGLLGLSFVALCAAMLFAFLNWQTISEKPKAVPMAAPAGGGGARPAPQGGAATTPPVAPAPQPGTQVPPPGGQQPGAAPPVGTTPPAGNPAPQKK